MTKKQRKLIEQLGPIRIGNQNYNVELVPELGSLSGMCDPTTSELKVLDGQPFWRTVSVLFHELLHAIVQEHSLNVLCHTDNHGAVDKEYLEELVEEDHVRSIEVGLLLALVQNPKLSTLLHTYVGVQRADSEASKSRK